MFIEERFPAYISDGATVQLFRAITSVPLRSGFERQKNVWAQSLRRYNVSSGIQTFDDLIVTNNFWYRTYGPRIGFRWHDPSDYNSTDTQREKVNANDQILGIGDGTETDFQLRKGYMSGTDTYYRDITKPVAGTVLAAVNATPTTAFSIDTTTGIVVFDTPPPNGALVTAGYQYDVPVRFEKETLEMNVSHFDGGDIPDIEVVEIIV